METYTGGTMGVGDCNSVRLLKQCNNNVILHHCILGNAVVIMVMGILQ